MNIIIPNPSDIYQATPQCYEWCINQRVVFYNNLEIGAVMFIVGALVMILASEFCQEHERLKKYSPTFIYLSKILIYAFFFVFFFVIKFNLIGYFN